MASKECIAVIDGLLDIFEKEQTQQVVPTKATPIPTQTKQYKWDWNTKLNASPFRREMKRLKADSKANPSRKSSNRTFRHQLKAQEKELLIDFQMKCDAAKIWINEAHQNYADSSQTNEDNPVILQQIAIQRKQEKVETIDQFWEELICYETVFVQNETIRRQNETMAQLEKQMKELQGQTAAIDVNTEQQSADLNGKKSRKKRKKKKKKADKDEYQGLIGYFNRPKPKKTKKKKKSNVKETKANEAIKTEKQSDGDQGGFLSYSYVPKLNDDDDEKKQKETMTVKDKGEVIGPKHVQKEKEKVKAKKGSMKGGFLKGGTNGLYNDKKQDSELTVDEKNIKNRKHIEEMGFADAVDKPFYTWERPKEERMNYQKETNANANQ
eukprot:432163_1